MNNGNSSNDPRLDPEIELDILLSRAVSGDRDALAAVRARGASDPSILEELAMWQADELRLARAAREIHAVADTVALPPARPAFGGRVGLGWAVAALIALAWFGRSVVPMRAVDVQPRENLAGFSGFATSDDAFDAYVEKARSEGVIYGDVEAPTIIGSRELGAGEGFEVLIMRKIVERRVLPELYRLAPVDESGALAPVVIRPRTEEIR